MRLLKVHRLEAKRETRGWSVEPAAELLASGFIRNVHVVSLEPGTVRGNHVHHRQQEFVMVFGGRCLVVAEDENGEREEMTVEPGEMYLFEIRPAVRHAFKNIDDHTTYLLACTDTPYDRENPDVEPAQII